MQMNRTLVWLVLSVVVLPVRTNAAAETARPNILLIVADDLGYADVGFQGCADIPTPAIDSLASNGVRFTNGYVSGPYCSPTRAGLLTGRYQQRFGHEFNPGGKGKIPQGLPLSETTMANRFQDAGYVTGLVGKWHLGSAPEFHPQNRGFDEFFGFLGGAHTYFNKPHAEIRRGQEKLAEPAYLTDAFSREAVSFIDRHQHEPFLLYLAFNAVHTPMEAEESQRDKFTNIQEESRKTYAAMLSSMDDAVGSVLKKLREAQLEEKTLIFFISDNGGPTMRGTTINSSNNAPLRGSKRTTLEGGIRVPFVMQWKGTIPAGMVYNHPVIQLDIQPTALAAAGVVINPEWNFDGVNLLPYLSRHEQGIPHETLFWRLGDQNAIRHGEWKLVQYDLNAEEIPLKGVSVKKLYYLPKDVGEAHDLATDYPEKVQELERLWDLWNLELAPPRW